MAMHIAYMTPWSHTPDATPVIQNSKRCHNVQHLQWCSIYKLKHLHLKKSSVNVLTEYGL